MNTFDFFKFIEKGTSPYHVVKISEELLNKNNFKKLDFKEHWTLSPGKKYYTTPYGTCCFAFSIGNDLNDTSIFRITSSHIDQPGFRIKPNPELFEKDYLKLNTETYGGAILNTWMDRPLSVSGKVTLKSENPFLPNTCLIDFERELLTIPNLAIHMNKKVNSGYELNKQIDLLPLFGMKETENENDFFLKFLAKELDVKKDSILDFDLYVYNKENACTFGRNQEFISSPRLDNLTSAYASLQAIMSTEISSQDILIAAFYDNEEIGSKTKQGADSQLTTILLEKIFEGLNKTKNDLNHCIMNSIMVSSDVAHGFHPNHGEKNDPTNITQLNKGVVIKLNSNQRYATDTEAVGIIQQLCEYGSIPYQKFVNRSDMIGGGTLGSISSSWLPMKTIDLGIPLLAMHSARETCSVADEDALIQLLTYFYTCSR